MSDPVKDGGPAFPVPDTGIEGKCFAAPHEAGWNGMSLRAYIAAGQMRALRTRGILESADQAAEYAVRDADALIKRLKED